MSIKNLMGTVTDDDLQLTKTSLRLEPDDTEDDILLRMLIKTARRDIIGQIGEQIDDFFDDNEVFKTAVLVEVGHLYNHRDSTSTQQEFEVPMALYSLINSMKDDYRYRLYLQAQVNTDGEKAEKNTEKDSSFASDNKLKNEPANSPQDSNLMNEEGENNG